MKGKRIKITSKDNKKVEKLRKSLSPEDKKLQLLYDKIKQNEKTRQNKRNG